METLIIIIVFVGSLDREDPLCLRLALCLMLCLLLDSSLNSADVTYIKDTVRELLLLDSSLDST